MITWASGGLNCYEGMHNLVAAFLQSLPTVNLNSVLLALGNKSSHGVVFPNGLFIAAIVASCLAMLRFSCRFEAGKHTSHEILW